MSVAIIENSRLKDLHHSLAERYKPLCNRNSWSTSEPTFLLRMFDSNCEHCIANVKAEEGLRTINYFIIDLHLLNQYAYDERYKKENNKPNINLKPNNDSRYLNDCALLKLLQCIRYNSIEAEGYNINNTFKILNDMIDALKDQIVDNLPEYQNAKWF